MARQLRIPTPPSQTLDESLLAFFAPRQMLVVVDNVEQLLSAAPLAEQILKLAPRLKVLATSREPLRIRSERVVAVAPLALPERGVPLDLSTLAAVPTVALFVSFGRDARPGFELTEANAAAVAEICRRLDGLPLALQLAAARLTVLSPAALLARLEPRLPLLTRGPRDLPARQQTLRAAIAWSYELLGPAERRLFRRLGVFVGGFTLEAVEALTEGNPDALDPLEAISSLVASSVVFVQPLEEITPRYGMLDTIREFALELLEEAGEAGETRRRHAEFIRDLVERAEPLLLVPAERRDWMAQLEHDYENIRTALAWSVTGENAPGIGVALVGALGWFWLTSGRLKEAGSWYSALLARPGEADHSLAWAKVLHGSALQLWGRGELAQAAAREESAVAIFRSAGDNRWLSYGLALLARVRTGQERPAEARTLLEEARAAWSRVQTTYGQAFGAYLLSFLGSAALVQDDDDTASAQYEASLRELDSADDDVGRAVVLAHLGVLAARRGEHARARAEFTEALQVLRGGGDRWDLALVLLNFGLEEARTASPAAGSLLIEALHAWQQLGSTAGVAFGLFGLGEVAAASGAPLRAGQLLGAGRALLPVTDPLLHIVVPCDLSARVVAARARGDATAFDRGLAEGQHWTIDEAMAAGLASPASPGTDLE